MTAAAVQVGNEMREAATCDGVVELNGGEYYDKTITLF